MNSFIKNSICIFILAIPIIFIFFQILSKDHFFTYTLDDPYIHIALAKNIFHGTYGINPTEMSAPSSSIIWPFILVPFANIDFLEYIPLSLNSIFVIISGFVLFRIFNFNNLAKKVFFTIIFLYAFNIYGLIFNGLEHNLQILLVIVICYYLINFEKIKNSRSKLILFLFSLILLPLVRYEGLAISIPILVYLFFNNLKKEAIIAITLLFCCITAFSLFLYINNLDILPSSVISKIILSNESILDNFKNNINIYGWFFSLVFIFTILTWERHKAIALILITTTVLHFLLGKYGWFSRYEVYYLVFTSVLMIYQIFQKNPNIWYFPILLIIAFPTLSKTTNLTAKASSNIYNQQFRMSQIAQKLNAPVAVNDLGLVALHSSKYVLDLWGLGSIEVLHYRKNPSDITWINRLMYKYHVNYLMIYDDWFPLKPSHWLKAGELKLTKKKITPALDTVTFYATDKIHLFKLQQALNTYQKEHPSKNYKIIIEE